MTNAYSEKDLGKEDEKGISPIEAILEKIPKTKINFKKHFILEDDILRDSQISTIIKIYYLYILMILILNLKVKPKAK